MTNLGGKRNPPTNAAAQSWGKNQYDPSIYYDYDFYDYQNGPAFSSYLNRKPAGPVGAETSPTAKTALRFQRTLPFVNSNNVINRGFSKFHFFYKHTHTSPHIDIPWCQKVLRLG